MADVPAADNQVAPNNNNPRVIIIRARAPAGNPYLRLRNAHHIIRSNKIKTRASQKFQDFLLGRAINGTVARVRISPTTIRNAARRAYVYVRRFSRYPNWLKKEALDEWLKEQMAVQYPAACGDWLAQEYISLPGNEV